MTMVFYIAKNSLIKRKYSIILILSSQQTKPSLAASGTQEIIKINNLTNGRVDVINQMFAVNSCSRKYNVGPSE